MSTDVGMKWWLISAKPGSCCSLCSSPIANRTRAAFCFEASELLCIACADQRGIEARPSRRLLAQEKETDMAVLEVPCPRTGCLAARGEECIDRSGNYKATPHAVREREAARRTQRPRLTVVRKGTG